MKRRYYFFALVIGCILVFGNLAVVFAQENETDEFTLEEITVTAQKREENQQKVAVAMDVITMEDIQGSGKFDLDEILSNISGVLVQRASDGLRVSIRGMYDNSQARSGQSSGTPSVAINMDGVYSNRKDSASGLYDLERVEVLYGPQSTMYSSNSPGGIVNIVTATPKLDEFNGSATAEYGNYELMHMEGAMNLPLGEKTAVRVSFSALTRDSYMSNLDTVAEDSKSMRVRTLYSPGDNVSLLVNAEHTKSGGTGFGGSISPFADQDEVDDPWNSTSVNESLGSNDHTSNKLSATVNLDAGFGAIAIVPSYSTRKGNNVNTMTNTNPETGEENTSTNYQTQLAREKGLELRMTSSSDFFFKWILGANYYKSMDNQTRSSEDYVEDPTTGYWTSTTMGQATHAFFANVTYPIMDRFRLTAGYRQSWDKMDSEDTTVQNETGSSAQGNNEAGTTTNTSEMENDGEPDYKLGFEYDLGANSMLYGDYSTSYRVAGMQGGGPDGSSENDPEELKAYTLGAKNRFIGNKLQLNVATYYYDYRNFVAQDSVSTTIGDEIYREMASDQGNGFMIGFDIQTSMIITPKDMLSLSVSYIKSEWDDLYFDYDYAEDVDYHGVPMAHTPPWTWNAAYTHNFNLSNGGALKTGITTKYQTGYRLTWSDIDLPYSYQEAFHMEDINVSYSHPNGKWTLSGYVNNVFNYAEKTMVQSSGVAGSIGPMTIGDPRTYAVALSVRFE